MAISYSPLTVTNGLVLYLDAANSRSYPGSGTTWTNLKNPVNSGTLVNGTGYSADNKGSLLFDGVNDYVDLGTPYFITKTTPWTVNVFMKINPRFLTGTQSAFHRIVSLRTLDSPYTFGLAYLAEPQFGYEGLYITSAGGWAKGKTFYHPTPNVWGFLTLTYNGNNSTVISNFNMYWNAAPLNLVQQGNETTPGATTDNNFIGVRTAGDIQIYRGSIATCQIYNRVLSIAEIKQNFTAARGRYGI